MGSVRYVRTSHLPASTVMTSTPRPSHRSPRSRLTFWLAFAFALLAPALLAAQTPDSTARDTTARDAVVAQDTTSGRPATHTVKKGDTLWDLARVYLGDPFLWPEIYRINTTVVEDPHWIYPGEVLRLPGGNGGEPVVVAEGPTQVDSGPAGPTGPVEELPAETSGPTMFSRAGQSRVALGSRRLSDTPIDPPPVVREWEYYAAPFVLNAQQRRGAGLLVESSEMPGIASARGRSAVQTYELVYVRIRGEVPARGSRYLVFRDGPDIDGVGRLVIPTGVAVVEAAREGEAASLRVVRHFHDVHLGDRLIPLESFTPAPAQARTPIEGGAESRIAYIVGEPDLASIQHYIIVKVGARDGVRTGDAFEIFRERKRGALGDRLPEERIAEATAVRVDERSATLIVTGQRHPAIREGARTRVIARMP